MCVDIIVWCFYSSETVQLIGAGEERIDEGSGSESEGSSQQSQTGKDFEIVDKAEIEAQQ